MISSFLALPSVALALLLAPEARVSTWHAVRVAIAAEASCRSLGVPPEVAVAMAFVESRFRTDRVSGAGALSIMQVAPSNLFVARRAFAPAAGPWALSTVEGGMEAGCRAASAIRASHARQEWLLYYACGSAAAKRRDKGCVEHQRRVMETLARLKHRREV